MTDNSVAEKYRYDRCETCERLGSFYPVRIAVALETGNSDNFKVFPHISAVILKITSPFLPSFAQRTSLPTLHPILVFEPLFKDTKPIPV